MRNPKRFVCYRFLIFFLWIAAANLNAQELDFAHDIVPILNAHCAKCHSGDSQKGGFSFNSRNSLLAGGESGPALVVGKSIDSALIQRVESTDPDIQMPPEGPRVPAEKVKLLKAWIDGGVRWEDGFAFKKSSYDPPLKPRRPNLPPAAEGRNHPIDRILDAHLSSQGTPRPLGINDEAFLRRVSMDLVGLLPEPERFKEFLADDRKDKRKLLIEELLAGDTAYAEHWLTFWNDLLRNDYGGTGFITNGRTQISRWLYKSLIDNKPYDQFARELLAPTPESAGFSGGIRWRGTVSAGQTVEIQFAQSVGQSFLGINLKCASCHDSFIDRWKLDDAYGLAAIYSSTPLDIHRCDKSIGKTAKAVWLFPELGAINADAPQPERLKQLAGLMTHPDNGRFTRTIVNRLWQRLMGRGIVHPVDAMQTEPWNADLLDFLAIDLADHGYDLKHTLALICSSEAYQSQSEIIDPNAPENPYTYRGPRGKRMTAEQFMDAVWQLTGDAPTKVDAPVLRGKVDEVAANSVELKGKWLWSYPEAAESVPKPDETISLRKSFDLDRAAARAGAVVTCDNSCTLYVNGTKVHASENWEEIEGFRIESKLKTGNNQLLLVAKNAGSAPNPAGVYFDCLVRFADGTTRSVASDGSWEWTSSVPDRNGKFKQQPDDWKPAAVIAKPVVWHRVERDLKLKLAHASLVDASMARASLIKSDALQRTLGRPNRDQIVTMRPNNLSTLEAIELNNAKNLAEHLESGAKRILAARGSEAADIVTWVTNFALSRKPSSDELAAAQEGFGREVTPPAVQDYLWAIIMQPEFQFIR